jgi:hypothetical protein
LDSFRRNLIKESASSANGHVPAYSDMDWEFPPVYDPAQNRLEYAVRSGIPGAGHINCYIKLLGRNGILDIVGVYPYKAGELHADFAPLRELVQGITFRNGYRYADHKAGDEMAHAGLVQLATNEGILNAWQNMVKTLLENKAAWGVAGVLGVLGLGCAFWAVAFRKTAKRSIAKATVEANGHGELTTAHYESKNGNGTAKKGVIFANGHRKRKRQVNYHAFYSDMVMSLTRCNYGAETASENLEYDEEQAMDAVERRTYKKADAQTQDTARMLVMETAKLIESQQKLIEGQRKLIEEQGKLIQEKSHLIDAETKVLAQQSELFAEQPLL